MKHTDKINILKIITISSILSLPTQAADNFINSDLNSNKHEIISPQVIRLENIGKKSIFDSERMLAMKIMLLGELNIGEQFFTTERKLPLELKSLIGIKLYKLNQKIDFSYPSIARIQQELDAVFSNSDHPWKNHKNLDPRDLWKEITFIDSGVYYSGLANSRGWKMVNEFSEAICGTILKNNRSFITCRYIMSCLEGSYEIYVDSFPLDSDGNKLDLKEYNIKMVKKENSKGDIYSAEWLFFDNEIGEECLEINGLKYSKTSMFRKTLNPQDVNFVLTRK